MYASRLYFSPLKLNDLLSRVLPHIFWRSVSCASQDICGSECLVLHGRFRQQMWGFFRIVAADGAHPGRPAL